MSNGTEMPRLIGYDLGNEYTQISYFDYKRLEPESVCISSDETGYLIPTVLFIRESTNEWLFGEEAVSCKGQKTGVYIDNILKKLCNNEIVTVGEDQILPELLIEKYFARTLALTKQKYFGNGISKLVVTTRYLNNDIKGKLYDILKKLGLSNDRLQIISYTECFMYYAISQKRELWANDVALFDYGEGGLRYCQLSIGRKENPAPIVANNYDFSEDFPYSLLQEEEKGRIAHYFEDTTKQILHHQLISTIYFTGTCFDDDWSDDILIKLCVGRRVFKGQNLYTKGACYAAKAMEDDSMKGFFFLSEDRLSSTISMKVYRDTKDCSIIFAKAGDYWDAIQEEICVILEDENTLDFLVNNLIKKDSLHSLLTLQGLPGRESKTIQLSVSLHFLDRNTAVIKVKDLGFGDFYSTSHRIWEFCLEV